MSKKLHRLVYLSRNEIIGEWQEVSEKIQRLHEEASARNSDRGITGVLMFNSGCFAQVLEGSGHDLRLLFDRICNDPRHSRVALLDLSPQPKPRYSNWSMAFVGQDAATLKLFTDYRDTCDKEAIKPTEDRLYDVLHEELLIAERKCMATLSGSDDSGADHNLHANEDLSLDTTKFRPSV